MMRKIIFYLMLLMALTACSAKSSADNLPDDFKSDMLFGECFGSTAESNDYCYEFRISLINENDNKQFIFSIDGNQTLRRLICDIVKENDEYAGVFNSYHEDDIHYSNDYNKGDLLFMIIKKTDHYYIKNFSSPFDNVLIQKEYLLTPPLKS